MIRPTTIPQTIEDLQIEQAIAREAIRLAFLQHKSFATSLKGVQQERTISDTFAQTRTGETLVDMMGLDILVGSGGVLSHAPRRAQAAHIMIDAFEPEGVTELAVDSIFMMPHLGVLATVHEEAAIQVFEKDCLIRLGTCIAPVGRGKEGRECIEIEGRASDGTELHGKIPFGGLVLFPLGPDVTVKVRIRPARGFDVGAGPGKEIEANLSGGVVGLILDTRGRPLELAMSTPSRIEKLLRWAKIQEVAAIEDEGMAARRT